jgi:hypothetical protein
MIRSARGGDQLSVNFCRASNEDGVRIGEIDGQIFRRTTRT